MKHERVRLLRKGTEGARPVIYWMSREQRVDDNWSLLYAQQYAIEHEASLAVVFCLAPSFLGATLRQYDFMLRGLQEVAQKLETKEIPFYLLVGDPRAEIPRFVTEHRADTLVTDFDPLRIKRKWKDAVARKIKILFYEVDAHNIVPCWLASPHQEYGAYTLRPKLKKVLKSYLDDFPKLKRHPFAWRRVAPPIKWEHIRRGLKVDRMVKPVITIAPGEKSAQRKLKELLDRQIFGYALESNDPTCDGQSGLSPYLHFGQIAPQRVALAVMKEHAPRRDKEAFLEQLIVRRELSDNYCFYNRHYDSIRGFPTWAENTLRYHVVDKREYIYKLKQFEEADTHDELWNAAQMEMMKRGKMHGYLRMYWAKKILEWTHTSEEAMTIAIYLNDKYELDGCAPNGYVGVAWSIGGVHDRAWRERPILGKIRYMSYNSCRSKFNIAHYVERIKRL